MKLSMHQWWNDTEKGKSYVATPRETCPTATLFTINFTWTNPRSNLGIHDERTRTNRLTLGTKFEH